MRIKDRLCAIGWLGFIIGSLALSPIYTDKPLSFTNWDKVWCGFVFIFTMLLAFMAGMENKKNK
jgi:hypothetical protein